MAKIKIVRKSTYADYFRKYKLFLDKNELDPIARNETKEFDISAGTHQIMARIDWAGSKEIQFDIKDGETRAFEISSFPHSKWLMPLTAAFILVDILLGLFFPDFELFFYLTIPGFLLLMYYISFGRSKYLTLKEVEA